MNLVMQADFPIRQIPAPGQLDAVHAQVGAREAGPIGVFGVDLGQRDEGAAVPGPACLLRQLVDGRRVIEDRSAADRLGPHPPQGFWQTAIAPGPFPGVGRIVFESAEPADGVQRVAEQELRSLFGAEEIADHRKRAAFDAGIEDGRSASLVDAALDFGRFQVRIDLALDADELSRPREVVEALAKVSIGHRKSKRRQASFSRRHSHRRKRRHRRQTPFYAPVRFFLSSRYAFPKPAPDALLESMNARRTAPRTGGSEPDDRLLREILGYLNFSGGKPDAAFQRNWNALYVRPEFFQADSSLPDFLRQALARLRSTVPALADSQQAAAVIELVFEHCLPLYRRHHADLLFHLDAAEFRQPFFLARIIEAVLEQGPPWNEPERIVAGALERLNDFVGYRPVAVLEN